MHDTPEQIAARLTKAQRKAMLKMPRHHSQPACMTRLALYLDGLQTYGKLTPLGAAVRAVVAKEDGDA